MIGWKSTLHDLLSCFGSQHIRVRKTIWSLVFVFNLTFLKLKSCDSSLAWTLDFDMITEVRFSAVANQGIRSPLASVSLRSRVVTRTVGDITFLLLWNAIYCYFRLPGASFGDMTVCEMEAGLAFSSTIIKFKGKALPVCSQQRSDHRCFLQSYTAETL